VSVMTCENLVLKFGDRVKYTGASAECHGHVGIVRYVTDKRVAVVFESLPGTPGVYCFRQDLILQPAVVEEAPKADPKTFADAVAKRWREVMWDHRDTVDPDRRYDWEGVLYGFLVGAGYSTGESASICAEAPSSMWPI
jgi:hypothetical protein